MKRLIYFILLSLLLHTVPTHAQKAIAKLKFEDAEKAYNEERYDEALKKLKEAEKAFGKINPPILYLRITAQDKILKNISDFYKEETSFQLAAALQKDCQTFLKQYGSVAGLEDKYKEVYNIQKSLANYPVTAEAWKLQKQKLEQEWREKIAQQERERKQAHEADSITGTMLQHFDMEKQIVATNMPFDSIVRNQRRPLRESARGKYSGIQNSLLYYTFNHFISELKPRGNPLIAEMITDSTSKKTLGYALLYMNSNDSKYNPVLFNNLKVELLKKMKQHFPGKVIEGEQAYKYNSGTREVRTTAYVTSESMKLTMLLVAIIRTFPEQRGGTCHIELFKVPLPASVYTLKDNLLLPGTLDGSGHGYRSLYHLLTDRK